MGPVSQYGGISLITCTALSRSCYRSDCVEEGMAAVLAPSVGLSARGRNARPDDTVNMAACGWSRSSGSRMQADRAEPVGGDRSPRHGWITGPDILRRHDLGMVNDEFQRRMADFHRRIWG